jgi:tetratricopeptide (TPR) repeat protein
MFGRNPLYVAIRLFLVMVGGVVIAIETGNPLWLGLTALGFGVLVVGLVTQSVAFDPALESQWDHLVNRGMGEGTKGEWTAALATFQTAMGKCRSGPERRQASERIGTFLLANDRIGEAEPYLRQALNLTTLAFGPMAGRTVALRDKLSDVYISTGQPGLAAQLQKGALEAAASAPSSNTLGAAASSIRYAEALQRQGDAASAATQNEKALKIIAGADPNSPLLIPALLSASRYAIRTGDTGRAEELLDRALKSANPDTPKNLVDEARASLLQVYVAQDRYADAVAIAKLRLRDVWAPEPGVSARMRRELADLMDRAGMTEEATKQRRVAQTLEGMTAAQRPPA